MQESVHVWERECGQVFCRILRLKLHLLVAGLCIKFVEALVCHQFLHLRLNLLQMQETWLIFGISFLLFFGWFCFSLGGAATFAFLLFTLLLFSLCWSCSF